MADNLKIRKIKKILSELETRIGYSLLSHVKVKERLRVFIKSVPDQFFNKKKSEADNDTRRAYLMFQESVLCEEEGLQVLRERRRKFKEILLEEELKFIG